MYRKKVVQRGEKHSEIDVEKPSANRFASLADSDVQFKRTDSYGKIFDYLHEKGMMKVATQSPIKEVPAKPRQKNFEKAHKTKTKKKSTQTAEKGNDKLEDTSTKKKPDKPTQTKVIPNAKGNDKIIQSLKEKIAKLQRELQSQFDTAATVMRKFKKPKRSMTTRRSLKRQTMPKPSLKMRRKRLKQVRKLNLRKISKKKRLTKRSLRTLRSRKSKSLQSKSHKIKRPLKCPNRMQSLLKRKLRKRKRINNMFQKSLSNSQKMVKMNKKRQLTQNRKLSQSQRKPRRRSKLKNIRNSLSNNRKLRKISKRLNPRKQLIYHQQYTPKTVIALVLRTKLELKMNE
ncbi:Hypothetical_protein [Hexamita inflata]|uniref:Hypothetical_protein n=1 Tax=Hexamita inflata TaxID=28002 RepID=A0AA86Q6A5_9EUKA|nr:Hypothetical protein HINF_LOCUS38996 [Hexamita inflata]